jgi:hypothetical protein
MALAVAMGFEPPDEDLRTRENNWNKRVRTIRAWAAEQDPSTVVFLQTLASVRPLIMKEAQPMLVLGLAPAVRSLRERLKEP